MIRSNVVAVVADLVDCLGVESGMFTDEYISNGHGLVRSHSMVESKPSLRANLFGAPPTV